MAAKAKERVNTEQDKIIQQADVQSDEAFTQINQLLEKQKKQLKEKINHLSQLSLSVISPSIQRIGNSIEHIIQDNQQLFQTTSLLPTIQVYNP